MKRVDCPWDRQTLLFHNIIPTWCKPQGSQPPFLLGQNGPQAYAPQHKTEGEVKSRGFSRPKWFPRYCTSLRPAAHFFVLAMCFTCLRKSRTATTEYAPPRCYYGWWCVPDRRQYTKCAVAVLGSWGAAKCLFFPGLCRQDNMPVAHGHIQCCEKMSCA